MRKVLDRLAIALMCAAIFCIIGAIPILIWDAIALVGIVTEAPTIGSMLESISGHTIASFGVLGAAIGALATKTATAVLVGAGNAMISAAEWCLRKARASEPESDS